MVIGSLGIWALLHTIILSASTNNLSLTKVKNIDAIENIGGPKTHKFQWKYRDIIDIDKN